MKNKYAKRSRISEAKIRQLVRCISADVTAAQAASLTGINRNTINRFCLGIHERIAAYCQDKSPIQGQVELDESFSGARCVPGKGVRGTLGKTIVFGIF